MRWSGATGASARGKSRSTVYARTYRSVPAWHWICGVKPKPKAGNKPSPHSIMHGLDKPGVFTTVSKVMGNCIAVMHRSISALCACAMHDVHTLCVSSGEADHEHCPMTTTPQVMLLVLWHYLVRGSPSPSLFLPRSTPSTEHCSTVACRESSPST